MYHKICQKCKIEKCSGNFCGNKKQSDGLNSWCKECVNLYVRERKKDPNVMERQKTYHQKYENKFDVKEKRKVNRKIRESKPKIIEEIKEKMKRYRSKPEVKEKTREYNKKRMNLLGAKEKKKEYDRQYNSKKEVKERHNLRLKIDALYRNKKNIRILIQKSLGLLNFPKKTKTTDILECDYDFFLMHLIVTAEKRYGSFDENLKYEIDHIIPLNVATTEEDVKVLNHYSNLQFLTKHDNASKSCLIPEKADKMEIFCKLSKETQEKIKKAPDSEGHVIKFN